MVTEMLSLLGLGLLLGVWLDASRQHERALSAARRLCARHEAQLLDETVALDGLRLVRDQGRLVLRRRYAFEASLAGNDRQSGYLWLIRGQLDGFQALWLQVDTAPASEARTKVVDLLERIARRKD